MYHSSASNLEIFTVGVGAADKSALRASTARRFYPRPQREKGHKALK
ncbi:hypothetical protein GPEL0_01r0569 [Geoanaerobacter pelophilus]|uniref:Uncharacterized protein n=1 Tax=Geoanaerobacter pelophilus TaxID=60036 RepID=A0ABQ0MF87_9BACT|nr:hypothetical protein GPEL0_01r0569 [Geoanaerobacter pelophilus]